MEKQLEFDYKTIFVNRVKQLDDKEGQKRFTLQENGVHFCIHISKDDTDDTIEKVRALYQDKEIIAVYREVETTTGEKVWQWYSHDKRDADTFATSEARRDVNALIEQKKAIGLAKVVKETKAQGIDISALKA